MLRADTINIKPEILHRIFLRGYSHADIAAHGAANLFALLYQQMDADLQEELHNASR